MKQYPVGSVSDHDFITEAPNINVKTSLKMRSSDGELVRYVDEKHEKWTRHHSKGRKRMFDALEAVLDINGGMWPSTEREELRAQDRHATSINIAKQKMETLNGSLMSEKFDFDYKPVDVEENPLVEDIKHWYDADKDDYNYGLADSETNMSGLIHAGVQGIFIDYSIRRTGAIGFKHYTDGTVMQDPNWQDNIQRNWKEAMIDGYLSPTEMVDKFELDSPLLRKLADADYYLGDTYEGAEDIRFTESVPKRSGSRFLTTEYRWVEKLKTTRLHVRLRTGEWHPLPLNVKEEQVRDFLQRMELSWMSVKEFPYEDSILQYCIISPDLTGVEPDLVFVRGKHPVQCGSIGLFKFSSNRMHGIDKGVFEYILDLNRSLNYRQSRVEDIIASSAGGATLVNKNKIGGDKGLKKLMQNKTDPSYVHPVDGSPEGVAAMFPTNPVPEYLFRELNNIVEFFDRVSPVTPALEGAATKDETGVLLELRHEITKLGTLRLFNHWQQFLKDKAEAWYNQAQIQYKDLYRKVPDASGTGFIEFNTPAFREVNGKRQKVYVNTVGDLPCARVVVKLSKSSPTRRMAKRLELHDTTKLLAAHPELFKNQIEILVNELLDTIERGPEEQLKLEKTRTLQEANSMLELFVKMEQTKAEGMEAQVMQKRLEQMMQNFQNKLGQVTGQSQSSPEQFTPANRQLTTA